MRTVVDIDEDSLCEARARGQLRAVMFQDLLLAATAERHGLVVIHYGADDDLIACVTSQPCEWVAPMGRFP